MKQRIYNGHSLDFFDSSNNHKAEIKLSGSQFVINPLGSGTVNISSSLTQGGELIFRHNNTGITMKDASNVSTRVFRLNSGNTMYIGPIDAYAGGGIIYGAATAVTSHAFYVGGASKLAVQATTSTFASNLNIFPNAATGTLRVGRYSGQEFKLHATDLINTLTSINDADENQTHEFILNRVHAGSGADNFKIQKDGSNQLTIDKNGLVTIPGSLTVTGTTTTVNSTNLDLSDNIIGLNRGASSNANDSGLIIERGSTGDNAAFLWDESADRFIFGTTTGTASDTGNISYTYAPFSSNALWTDSSAIAYWGNANTAYGTLTWDTGFASILANSGNRLRIGSHGSQGVMVVSSSLVGIGTETPLTKLHIVGTTDANIIRIENTVTSLSLGSTIGAIQFFNNDPTDNSPNVAASIYATAGASGGSGALRFKTTEPGTEGDPATDTMIITNGGRVGIGNTDPIAKFEVTDGASSITLQEYNSGAAIFLDGVNGDFTGGDYYHILANGSTYLGLGGYAGGVTRLNINSSGNVGIGDVTPSSISANTFSLSVNSSRSDLSGALINKANGTIKHQQYWDSSGYGFNLSASSGAFRWLVNNSEKMRIDADGDVGIGISSPMSHLHVNKAVTGNNTDGITIGKVESNGWIDTNEEMGRLGWAASYGSSYTPAIGAYISAKADANWNGNEAPTRLGFFTAPENSLTPVERLTIKKDGNVGIGELTPDHKLQVGGPVNALGYVNDEGGNKNRLLFPKGASLNSGIVTGAIRIKLPVSWTNTMMRIKVRIYDYTNGESFDVNLAGYNHTGGSGYWVNTSAWIDSQAGIDRNFTVRFGYENSCCIIYIGELASSWTYVKVNVIDVMLNHSGTVGAWATGDWAITTTTSAFAAVTRTITNCQTNNWARTGQDVYFGSGTGNVGIGTTSGIDARLKLVQANSGTNNTIITQDNARKIFIGRDSIKATDLSNNAAMLYIQQNDGEATFGGPLFIDAGLTVGTSNAHTAQIGLKHLLGYCENTDIDIGTEDIKTLALATYQAVFFDYLVKNGTNLRAGTITAVHDGTNVTFNEVSTVDVGNTGDIKLGVIISGTNLKLQATVLSNNWIVKANIRGIKV